MNMPITFDELFSISEKVTAKNIINVTGFVPPNSAKDLNNDIFKFIIRDIIREFN